MGLVLWGYKETSRHFGDIIRRGYQAPPAKTQKKGVKGWALTWLCTKGKRQGVSPCTLTP